MKTVGLRFRLVDARGQVVGRLAAQLATILQVCFTEGAAGPNLTYGLQQRQPCSRYVAGQGQAYLFAA